MRLPHFVVLGAAKAGTTALYDYIGQHPQVFVTPQKETHFFALDGERPDWKGPNGDYFNRLAIWRPEVYAAQFDGARQDQRRGEVCPSYLYRTRAAERLAKCVPDARLAVVLRDPAQRAFSHYLFHVREGLEPAPTLREALRDEDRRVRENWFWGWHVLRLGFYHAQLRPYLERFPREQLRVWLYSDLRRDQPRVLRELFEHVGVDPGFEPDTSRRPNKSGVPRHRRLLALLTQDNPVRRAAQRLIPDRIRLGFSSWAKGRLFERMDRPSLFDEDRAFLVATYRDDILQLQDVLNLDLSAWLRVEGHAEASSSER